MLIENNSKGIDIGHLNFFLLMYADDIVIFANNPTELQKNLDILSHYCSRWKLKVNIHVNKTKIMVFRKGGRIPTDLSFSYNNCQLEIVNNSIYLSMVFTTGGSLQTATDTLTEQAQKALFTFRKYLHIFVNISPDHVLDLFVKLIKPILLYGSEIWGAVKRPSIERVHTLFMKSCLGVKVSTQNDFVYCTLGRLDMY